MQFVNFPTFYTRIECSVGRSRIIKRALFGRAIVVIKLLDVSEKFIKR